MYMCIYVLCIYVYMYICICVYMDICMYEEPLWGGYALGKPGWGLDSLDSLRVSGGAPNYLNCPKYPNYLNYLNCGGDIFGGPGWR